MLDDFDGFISALTDGFDGAVGLGGVLVRGLQLWNCATVGTFGGGMAGEGKNDSRRGSQFGGTEAGGEGRIRGLCELAVIRRSSMEKK